MARSILDRLDRVEQSLAELDHAISAACEPWAHQIELLLTIPGVGPRVAQTIVAETGADMSQFPTAAHLASWAARRPTFCWSGACHEWDIVASASAHQEWTTRNGQWLPFGRQHASLPGGSESACGLRVRRWHHFRDLPFDLSHPDSCPACCSRISGRGLPVDAVLLA